MVVATCNLVWGAPFKEYVCDTGVYDIISLTDMIVNDLIIHPDMASSLQEDEDQYVTFLRLLTPNLQMKKEQFQSRTDVDQLSVDQCGEIVCGSTTYNCGLSSEVISCALLCPFIFVLFCAPFHFVPFCSLSFFLIFFFLLGPKSIIWYTITIFKSVVWSTRMSLHQAFKRVYSRARRNV